MRIKHSRKLAITITHRILPDNSDSELFFKNFFMNFL